MQRLGPAPEFCMAEITPLTCILTCRLDRIGGRDERHSMELRHLLKPVGDVDRVAQHREFEPGVVADGADEGVALMHADADHDRILVRYPAPLIPFPQHRKDRLGAGDGAPRVVYLMTIDGAKFRKPVVPGDVLEYHVRKSRSRGVVWKFQCEGIVAGVKVAEAEISAMLIDQ